MDSAYKINSLDITQLIEIFQINAINPKFLIGLFLGGMTAFVFCAFTILAVGRAAGEMVEEVRRQFKEIPGILEVREPQNMQNVLKSRQLEHKEKWYYHHYLQSWFQ